MSTSTSSSDNAGDVVKATPPSPKKLFALPASVPALSQNESSTTPSSGSTGKTIATASTESMPGSQELEDRFKDKKKALWGRMITTNKKSFHDFPLFVGKDKYTFGRAHHCDYSFDVPLIRNTTYFQLYSKLHFSILREKTGSDRYQVWIQDHGSKNGILVNEIRVPRRQRMKLDHNDRVALCVKKNVVFEFNTMCDYMLMRGSGNPPEISKKYHMLQLLGNGAFGQVYEAQRISDARQVAIKIIPKKAAIAGDEDRDVMIEANILQKAQHRFVIKVHEVMNTSRSLFIVMEFATGGELYERCKNSRLSEGTVQVYLFQILTALQYLHSINITHRDLKPENVLMMSKEEHCLLKVTDFGVSRLVEDGDSMHSVVGTEAYCAPELLTEIEQRKGYNHLVDLWSMGVILYVCLAGYQPFSPVRVDSTNKSAREQIIDGNYVFHKKVWKDTSSQAKDLISALLKTEPSERLSTTTALQHEWLKDGKAESIVNKLELGLTTRLTRANLKAFIHSPDEAGCSNRDVKEKQVPLKRARHTNTPASCSSSDSPKIFKHVKR